MGLTESELLQGVREWLDVPEHWLKGTERMTGADGSIRTCLLGAIYKVAMESADSVFSLSRTSSRILHIAREQFPEQAGRWHFVSSFNDDPAVTLDDVQAVLDKAVAEAEEGAHDAAVEEG